MSAKIDGLTRADFRKDDRRHQVNERHLQQDDQERVEPPLALVLQAEAGPPGLRCEEQDEDAPDERR